MLKKNYIFLFLLTIQVLVAPIKLHATLGNAQLASTTQSVSPVETPPTRSLTFKERMTLKLAKLKLKSEPEKGGKSDMWVKVLLIIVGIIALIALLLVLELISIFR